MTITRNISEVGLSGGTVHIELHDAELREAYDEYQQACRMEDIRCHLEDMNESDLSGHTATEVTASKELLWLIFQSFMKHQSCELAENDVMEECIRTVLAEQAGVRKEAF